ncbi:MAG: ZIP family metal transporter [candidate division WOR-3 bacterium]|nr:MAG: ZIP family metal transporter [candidate division WOR-3 bacterium]
MVVALTIGSVIIVSLLSLVGIFTLSLNRERMRKMLIFVVAFAVGALFGDVFIHLLPESFEKIGANLTTSLLVIGGFLVFFVLEKFIRWRHVGGAAEEQHVRPVVMMNLVGDATHNLIDGMLIAASYIVSVPIGITTTLAIVLHEIPQEIGDFGILIHGGLSVRKALSFNLLAALMSVIGAMVTLIVGAQFESFAVFLLPVTAGGFIYIAGPDLIPELQQEVRVSHSIWQFSAILLGVVTMALLTLIE